MVVRMSHFRVSALAWRIILCLCAMPLESRATVPSAADVTRDIGMVFAGGPGAAGGDVNADGSAGAADVVGVLLGLRSPTQPGPYGVGVQRITFTKQSVTVPGQPRVLLTDIWYPGPPGTGPTAGHPGGKLNAPLADGVHDLPLVMFSHGSCAFPEQSVFFTALLASYGFVVAAPPHPGNTISEYATCGTPAAETDSFANRPADISFVIDALLGMNADPSSFFFTTIDPSRIGMSGHSYGGLTTLRVSALDARVIAGLAMAPVARSIEDEIASIRIPTMLQVGTLDDLQADSELAFSLLHTPRYLLEIDHMPHLLFSDFCPACGAGSISADAAHLYILRHAIPFLLHWVADDHRFDAFLSLPAAPPGVRFMTD